MIRCVSRVRFLVVERVAALARMLDVFDGVDCDVSLMSDCFVVFFLDIVFEFECFVDVDDDCVVLVDDYFNDVFGFFEFDLMFKYC